MHQYNIVVEAIEKTTRYYCASGSSEQEAIDDLAGWEQWDEEFDHTIDSKVVKVEHSRDCDTCDPADDTFALAQAFAGRSAN